MSFVAVGVAGLGVSALGTVGGLIGSSRENKRQNAYLQDYLNKQNKNYFTEKGKTEDWYNKNNINYMDTAEAQGTITRLKDAMREQNDVVDGNSAITGATNANSIAQKKASQGVMANYMNQLASRGTQRKDQIENQYFLRNKSLSDFRSNIDSAQLGGKNAQSANRQQNWSNFMGNLSNMGSSALGLGAGGYGGGETPTNTTGNGDWFNGNKGKMNLNGVYDYGVSSGGNYFG